MLKMLNALRICLVASLLFFGAVSYSEEYALPDAAELSAFSPEALDYYKNGVYALDKVDYYNAYNNFLRASQLQPEALRLNMITAALAIREGRTLKADEAPEAYANAVSCYQNVLRQKKLDEATLRTVLNKTKMAMQETDAIRLAQRDARREAIGTQFVTKLNQDMQNAKSLFDDAKKKKKSKSSDKTLLTRTKTSSPRTELADAFTDMYIIGHDQRVAAMKQQQQNQMQQGNYMGMGMPNMGAMPAMGGMAGAAPNTPMF